MPVPVPTTIKPQAHPVIKPSLRARGQSLPSNTLVTLPVGAHPILLGLGNEWGAAFPSWRRNQQRPSASQASIIQDFHKGLTNAGNALVSKGFGAQASLPPMYNSSPSQSAHTVYGRGIRPPSDSIMESALLDKTDQIQLESNMRWDVDFLVGPEVTDAAPQDRMHHNSTAPFPTQVLPDSESDNHRSCQMGAFSPIYEDQSPGSASGPDNDSSPLEPITPFGAFVDRVVADVIPYPTFFSTQYAEQSDAPDYYNGGHTENYQAPPVFPTLAEPPKAQESYTSTITPGPTLGYKTLAEPLAEWVANFAWKACTTGFSLPPAYARPSISAASYPAAAPSFLAPSIHSLFLATLLQPSVILLAVWYIVQLPVYVGSAPLDSHLQLEIEFRNKLFAEGYTGLDNASLEGTATFRLVVLGCMLANKWLDDHTFSNKTWHSISNIPIQTLNELELGALKVFAFDLSISSQQWSRWLSHVMSYHMSLSSPAYPQPISRPSSNPHSIVRRVIDEVIKVPSTFKAGSRLPQPVFIGLEDRLRERSEKESALDALEIDLDEDGPLREEYLPKRRASKLGSQSDARHGFGMTQEHILGTGKWGLQDDPASKGSNLPPPAKWSPSGDEPILRDRNRVSGQYVAVQPHQQYSSSYHIHDGVFNNQNWNPAGAYMPVKAQPVYVHDAASVFHMNQSAYNPFGQLHALVIPHSRSHSLSYDQEMSRNHMRSYSQTRFEYKNSDIRVMPNEHIPFQDMSSKWTDPSASYLQHSQAAYIHIPSIGIQPTW